jgi:5-methylcytosine-specific restriction endonuclease McrA
MWHASTRVRCALCVVGVADAKTWQGAITGRPYRRLRQYVLERDRFTCQIAGPHCTHVATEVDHTIARADGGALYDPANLRGACHICNAERGEVTRLARWRGARINGRRPYLTSVPPYQSRL